MADIFTKAKRSLLMANIRSSGNEATEKTFVRELKRRKITGWRLHLRLPGTPDISFPRAKTCVFLHGCFWHGCPRCYRVPKVNQAFWRAKVENNKIRDRRVVRQLRAAGWQVLIIWQCSLRRTSIGRSAARLERALSKSSQRRSLSRGKMKGGGR